jgi:hypothetical protein
MIGEVFIVEAVKMFISETTPPTTGKIPSGSGELRSLNHQKPSVRIPG